ncbi:guanylate kinase [Niveomyces insectorum RCEF 264]|uniref:Guanylate kinase n=1 Tax=Niveomyces insectorum RCEF 264 TaxID=1081102 RepID=A0A167QA38_9HYPO|nr:guanylate kinase [Niveomyces insectorum RCEF 264]
MALPSDRRPIVISGPSGVGKGTLYNMLFERHPGVFCLSVSHTTRSPRAGEQNGQHYHFVNMAEFEDLIARDAFVEHAQFGGNRYGTSKQTVADQAAKGRVVVLDIEMEGVKQIQAKNKRHQEAKSGSGGGGGGDNNDDAWAARYVFIAPPSIAVLEQRLRGRGTETEANVQKRLAQATRELEYAQTPGVHDKIIVNDDLETAYKELEAFVYQKPPAEQK